MTLGAAPLQVEELTEEVCAGLLREHEVGRLAFSVAGQPEIFPVNYTMDGDVVVLRTAPGTKLRQVPNRRVAFEIDGIEATTGIAWSVVVKGLADDVTNRQDPFATGLRAVRVDTWAPGERLHHLVIYPEQVSGRRFRTRPL
ncbi:MAG: pyridoxamine 5'-phosphate oxidase family protein [Chloroflexota bacterium]